MENDRVNIDLVKERTDIVSVVERYVHLKQAGKNFSGLCPFHQEKTPSFNVSPDIQIYKCFGCGKSGDVINFVQEIEKIDFAQALEKLAKEAGIELKTNKAPISPALQINQWAKVYFQKVLYSKDGEVALKYLKSRGITDKIIESFGIGYAPGNNNFMTRLKSYKSYDKRTLLDSGLFVEKDGSLKEKFNKRVVFPIYNLSGKVIAYTGRVLPGNEYGPKYLNSPETSIFQKRNSLYGFYQGKGSIKREDLCILLEGQTDVISLHKAGYTNSVAPLGTGLTLQQLELISSYTKNILFIFDNDSAGQTALERAFKLAITLNMNCYAVNTGKYKDIDELIQSEPDKLKELIESRKDAFSYLLANKVESMGKDSLKSLMYIEKYLKSLIQAISHETTKNFFLSKAKSMIPELNIETKYRSEAPQKQLSKKSVGVDIEDMYLKALLDQVPTQINDAVTADVFNKKEAREVFTLIAENSSKNSKELYALISNPILKSYFENLLLLKTEAQDINQLTSRVLKRYLEDRLKQQRILLAIAEEKEDTTRIKELLDQAQEYSNKLKKLKDENI